MNNQGQATLTKKQSKNRNYYIHKKAREQRGGALPKCYKSDDISRVLDFMASNQMQISYNSFMNVIQTDRNFAHYNFPDPNQDRAFKSRLCNRISYYKKSPQSLLNKGIQQQQQPQVQLNPAPVPVINNQAAQQQEDDIQGQSEDQDQDQSQVHESDDNEESKGERVDQQSEGSDDESDVSDIEIKAQVGAKRLRYDRDDDHDLEKVPLKKFKPVKNENAAPIVENEEFQYVKVDKDSSIEILEVRQIEIDINSSDEQLNQKEEESLVNKQDGTQSEDFDDENSLINQQQSNIISTLHIDAVKVNQAINLIYSEGSRLCDAASLVQTTTFKTRSAERKSEPVNIVDDKDVSYTYGEITKGTVENIISLLTDGNKLMKLSNNRIPEITDQFKLSDSSIFFDLGSGTGMVVLHVGVKVGCRSFGVEVSPNRFNLSLELKDSLIYSNLISEALGDKFHFFNNNCASFEDLALIDNQVPTHIFSFNARFNDDNLKDIFKLLNKTAFKVLIINQTPKQASNLGLQNVVKVNTVNLHMRGSNQKLTSYVYLKVKCAIAKFLPTLKVEIADVVDNNQVRDQVEDQEEEKKDNRKIVPNPITLGEMEHIVEYVQAKRPIFFLKDCLFIQYKLLVKKLKKLPYFPLTKQSSFVIAPAMTGIFPIMAGFKTQCQVLSLIDTETDLEASFYVKLISRFKNDSSIKYHNNIFHSELSTALQDELKVGDKQWRPTHVFINSDPSIVKRRFYSFRHLITNYEYDVLIINATIEQLERDGLLKHKSQRLIIMGFWYGHRDNQFIKFYIYRRKSPDQDQEERKEPALFLDFDIAEYLREKNLKALNFYNRGDTKQSRTILCKDSKGDEQVLKFEARLESDEYDYQWSSSFVNEWIKNHVLTPFKGYETVFTSKLILHVFAYDKQYTDLDYLINSLQDDLSAQTAMYIFKDIYDGVMELHKFKIGHGNLELRNILLTKQFIPLIADFSQAVNIKALTGKPPPSYPNGTHGWRAPEVIRFEKTGQPYRILMADLWSLGCILYYLLFRKLPYSEDQLEQEQIPQLSFPWEQDKKSIRDSIEQVCCYLLAQSPKSRKHELLGHNIDLIYEHYLRKNHELQQKKKKKMTDDFKKQTDIDAFRNIMKRVRNPREATRENLKFVLQNDPFKRLAQ